MRIRVQFIHQQFQVFRRRPAASADNRDVVLGHEFIKIIRKRFRLERINGLTIHVERKPGVGNARNRKRGLFAEDADGLAHVLGSGGTVETNYINAETFEDGERGFDICAKQHAPGRIERDLSLNRQINLSLVESLVNTGDGGFDFEDVLRGFNEEKIHTAADQTDSLFAKNIGEFIEADVGKFRIARRGKLARWTDGTRDETRLIDLRGLGDLGGLGVRILIREVDAQGARQFR